MSELNRQAAECMGWYTEVRFGIEWYKAVDGSHAMMVDRWDPEHNMNHAHKLLEAWRNKAPKKRKYGTESPGWEGDLACCVLLELDVDRTTVVGCATHTNPATAITLAVLKVDIRTHKGER